MGNAQTFTERVVKGSFAVLFLAFLGSAFAYIIRILYSRSLSVEDYGLFYAMFGFFSIISVNSDLGFGEALVYFIPKYFKLKKYKILWNTFVYGQLIQIGIAILASIIIVILAPFLSANYFKVVGSETLIYIFCIFLIINSVLNSLLQIFIALQKVKYYSSIQVLRVIFVLLLSLLFLSLDLNAPIYFAISWVFGYFITTLIYLYLLWDKHPILTRNNLIWHKGIFNTMYKYAIPAFATTFISTLLASNDIFFLTLLKGVTEVGIYNVIVPLASISIMFLTPINSILFPLVSHLYEGEKEKLSLLVNKIYQLVPFVGVYFSLFIILFPSSIVVLTFGEKWRGLTEVSLSLLSLGYIAYLFSNILGIIILGMGKVNQRLKIFIRLALLAIFLNALFVFKYGVLGAVITNSLIAILLCLIFTRIIRDAVFLKIPMWFYFKLILISVIIFFVVRFIGFTPLNWVELIISGMVYTVIFVCLGFLLKIYDKKLLEIILPFKNL